MTQYQFRRLPFSLSSAPRTFTRVTLPLVTLCRTQGIRIIVYLDDFLVLGRSKGELRSHTGFVLNVLKKKGFQWNPKKRNLEPRQEFQYLGIAWNTKNLRVFLPEDKRNDFRVLGLQILRNPNIALAQRFLGKAIFAWRSDPLGRLHIRPFQMSVIKALKSGRLILDGEAERAIRWWTRTPEDGVELRTPPTTLSMTTHASASGWGATLDHRSAIGKWTVKEAELHINHLELLAVMKAVQAFVLILRNKGVTVYLDNVTAFPTF